MLRNQNDYTGYGVQRSDLFFFVLCVYSATDSDINRRINQDFEACHEPSSSDCDVVLGSCGELDNWEAAAAACANQHNADCGCVTDELDCYAFVSTL